MKQNINCFHPDYVKTYMPEFLTSIRFESRQTKAGQDLSKHVEEKRKTVPSHGTILGISKKVLPAHQLRPKEMMKILTKKEQSMTMQEVTNELIDRLRQKGKK
jgi:primosomal protein N'